MSEIEGAMSGATAGASMGSAFGPWGAVIGGVIGGVGGLFSGKKKKKRAEEIQRQIQQLSQKIAQSMRRRAQNADKLYDAQVDLADEQIQEMLSYVAQMKLNYQGLFERNASFAEEQGRELMFMIDDALEKELGLNKELFDEFNKGVDELYTKERDLIQVQLAHDSNLADEFKTEADQALKDTWQASDEAKVDLKNLKDSGGRPVYFDQVMADNAKAFNNINKDIDRSDAGRGRSDLTGKKLTSKFAEAMQRGQNSAMMYSQGKQQEAQLRGEIAGLGNQAMNQAMARLQGSRKRDGEVMANLESRYGQQKLNNLMGQGQTNIDAEMGAESQKLDIEREMNDYLVGLKEQLEQGKIDMDEYQYLQNRAFQDYKMGAKQANVQYHDGLAREHERAMKNQIGVLQGRQSQATAQAQQGMNTAMTNASDFLGSKQGQSMIGGIKGLFGGKGKGQSGQHDSYNFGPPNSGGVRDSNPWYKNLMGLGGGNPIMMNSTDGSTVPANPYEQRHLGRRRYR